MTTDPMQEKLPNYRLADALVLRRVERASERPDYGVDAAKAQRKGAFRSRAQWRAYFANPLLRALAIKRAHETEGPPKVKYRKLPERKRRPGEGTP